MIAESCYSLVDNINLPQICVLVSSIQTVLPWISLSISFSTTDLMDIIQGKVRGDIVFYLNQSLVGFVMKFSQVPILSRVSG